MTDTLQFALWFLGVPAIVVAIALVNLVVEWAGCKVDAITDHHRVRLANWRYRTASHSFREQDTKAFEQWIASKSGELGDMVDAELVDAQRQSELIRLLVEDEVPKAVMHCVNTHRLMANVTGAYHMGEIALEPECYQLRKEVIWLLGHTVRLLSAYPLRFDDTRLLHNSIVLRKRALPTCRRCPYIELPTDQLPQLCPTAELVQLRGGPNGQAS